MSTRIIVAENSETIRICVTEIIRQVPGLEIIREATNNEEALNFTLESSPDVLFFGLLLGGEEPTTVVRKIKQENMKCRVLVFSVFTDKRFLLDFLWAGADGYYRKDGDFTEIPQAIRAVASGRLWLSQGLSLR